MADVPGSLFYPTTFGVNDIDGNPLADGFVYFYVVGTATPKDTFSDIDLTVANTNPVQLDDSGRATVYLEAGAYTAVVTDADGVTVPIDLTAFEDVGQTLFSTLNPAAPPTIVTVTSGYTVLDTDQLVLVNSTGGANPCIINLLPAADMTQRSVTIKNLGEIDLAITPDGTDTLELTAGVYTVQASALPMCPSIVLSSDQASNWYIESGLGIV